MERRGEWKLDDPVAKHLPEGVRVPAFEGRTITLRNLARQDSGLPWHPDSLEKALQQEPREKALQALKKAADAFTAEDLHQFLPTHRLTNAPGARFRYSNVGMALLGHAAERRAGESFESLVVQRICGPLGMNSTRIKLPPPLQPRLARAHWADGERAGNLDFQVLAPAGALLSSVNDLLKFVAASLGFTKSELSPLLEEMQVMQHSGDPRFGSTATPWVNDGVYQPPRSVLLGHGGGGFGYLAFIGFDKGRGRGVVVLSNQVEWGTSGVGWTILQGLPLTRDHVMSLVREIVGLGIALDTHKASGLPVITRVFPGSSAGQAGVKPGQLIRTINGVAVAGKTLNECLALMGGEPGAKVTLELSSADRKETSTVELTRQKFITTTEG
jgi:serine-type D-Ala-D-Ala carboxypeptidase/endopeptidase